MNSSTSGWLVLTRNSLAGSHPQNDTPGEESHSDSDDHTRLAKSEFQNKKGLASFCGSQP
jgi:hypothetical protein